jgi:hypothetical protein
MKNLKKILSKAVCESWKSEFPFLMRTRDEKLKTDVFVCDKYWATRYRIYRFWISGSNVHPGKFYLEIEVTDQKTPLYMSVGPPSPYNIGMFRINDFEGTKTHTGWHITGRTVIDETELNQRLQGVIADINARLKKSVFPKLEILTGWK